MRDKRVRLVRMPLSIMVCTFLLLSTPLDARTSLAVFPLVNSSNDDLVSWIGPVLPEFVSRKLGCIEGLQVWDPVFLFAADSSGWAMASDSILLLHRSRWQWDGAIGGSYAVAGDSIAIDLRFVRYRNGFLEHREFRSKMVAAGVSKWCAAILLQVISNLDIALSPEDAKTFEKAAVTNLPAFRTYAAGYGFEIRGEYSAALTAYGRAAQLDMGFPFAGFRIGRIYRRGGDIPQARKFLERALSISPRDPLIAAELAGLRVEHDTPEKARRFISARRGILERTACGMTVMARFYAQTGELSRASALLTKAIAFGPADLETEYLLGTVYLSLGQSQLASDVFKRLVTYRPGYIGYHFVLGSAYRDAGMLLESADILETALGKEPANTAVLIALAHTYFKLNRFHPAEQLLLRARDINPLLGEVDLNLGVLYWQMGRVEDARRVIEYAARRGAGNISDVLNNLGNIYLRKGNTRRAMRAYRRSLRAKRNQAVLYNLAQAHLSLGDLRAAYTCLEEVSRQLPARTDVLLDLARLARHLGRSSDAERHYRRVMELVPLQETAVAGIVELLQEEKRHEEAASYIEGFLERFPHHKRFRLLMGELLLEMDWYEVAEMRYREITKDYPRDFEALMGLGRSLHGLIVRKGGTQFAEAVSVLGEAAKIKGGDSEPDILIAEIYLARNYHDRALEHLSKARGKAGNRAVRSRIDAMERKVRRP